MVFLEDERTPTFKHSSIESAQNEAMRLAKEYKRKAYVLVSIKSFELNEFIVTDCRPRGKETELPF